MQSLESNAQLPFATRMEDWTCLGQHKRHPEFPVKGEKLAMAPDAGNEDAAVRMLDDIHELEPVIYGRAIHGDDFVANLHAGAMSGLALNQLADDGQNGMIAAGGFGGGYVLRAGVHGDRGAR